MRSLQIAWKGNVKITNLVHSIIQWLLEELEFWRHNDKQYIPKWPDHFWTFSPYSCLLINSPFRQQEEDGDYQCFFFNREEVVFFFFLPGKWKSDSKILLDTRKADKCVGVCAFTNKAGCRTFAPLAPGSGFAGSHNLSKYHLNWVGRFSEWEWFTHCFFFHMPGPSILRESLDCL